MNKEEFVPPQESLDLKDLGFDEECFGFYLEDGEWVPASYSLKGTIYPSNSDLLKGQGWVSSPLYQQAFRWFRKNYNLVHRIQMTGESAYFGAIHRDTVEYLELLKEHPNSCVAEIVDCYSPEEADLECLRELIRIVKALTK